MRFLLFASNALLSLRKLRFHRYSVAAIKSPEMSARTMQVCKSLFMHRITCLFIDRAHLRDIFESGLPDCGWLTDIFNLEGLQFELPEYAKRVLEGNRFRHYSCSRACVTMIHARKERRALTLFDSNVVAIIAQCLWETRNESEWEDVQN